MRDLILLTSMQLTFSNSRLMTMAVHNIRFGNIAGRRLTPHCQDVPLAVIVTDDIGNFKQLTEI
jgi:hypothetical protein